jgi:transglutaminase/protease-like cytokinesis protein 3
MPVIHTDLLAPNGPVELEFFEDENIVHPTEDPKTILQVRLETYIAEGYLEATAKGVPVGIEQDIPAKNWALYRSYLGAYNIKISRPATDNQMALSLPSSTFIKAQIDAFAAEAEKYLDAFNDSIAQALTDESTIPVGYSGQQTVLEFDY